MSEIVKGLFGVTPNELAMRRNQEDETAALAFARLSPTEIASYGISRGAGQLARGVVGMLGATDPEMKKASDLDSILKTSDTTSVEGLRVMAKKAADMGYGNEAMQASAAADKMEQDQADLGFKRSQTNKNLQPADTATPEMKNAAAIAASQGAAQGSPEWATIYKTELARLTAGTTGSSIKEVGVAEATRQPVYFDTTTKTQFIMGVDPATGKQIPIPFSGGVDKTTSKVNVSAESKGPIAGSEEIFKLDARTVSDARTIASKAIDSAGVLQQIANTPQDVVGAGAPARVAALRVFSTIGLTSAKDNKALGNADTFNALAGERVLGFIKTLGTNPTDTDREFARSIGPALEKGTKTNQDLVAYLLKRSREVVQSAKSLEEHYYANNGSLRGYTSPFLSNLQAPNPLQNLSNEELADKIEAAKKAKR